MNLSLINGNLLHSVGYVVTELSYYRIEYMVDRIACSCRCMHTVRIVSYEYEMNITYIPTKCLLATMGADRREDLRYIRCLKACSLYFNHVWVSNLRTLYLI